MLNNTENQKRLADQFNVEQMVSQFVNIQESDLKLRALLALSLFAYNSLENQRLLKCTNAILYNAFRPFIESNNPRHAAMACFQVRSTPSFPVKIHFSLVGGDLSSCHCG